MKLRHKKPLNPYKGQTNSDKNEFNDDDFRQQGSPHKKNGNAPTDQIFKYAKILSKFIKTINQDYRFAMNEEVDVQLNASPEKSVSKLRAQMQPERQTVLGRKQQLKQQKQITKLQNKIELKEEKKQYTSSSRRREAQPSTQTQKQTKGSMSIEYAASNNTVTFAQRSTKVQQENKQSRATSDRTEQIRISNEPPLTNKPQNIKSNITPAMGVAPPSNQLPNVMPNFPNMMNMPTLPPNFQALMNQNQMLGNLNLMNINGMNNINPMQLSQLLMRNYAQSYMYGGIPVGMNMNNLGMMGLGVPGMQNNPQLLFAQNRNNQKPFSNLFNQQVNSFKICQKNPQKTAKEVYPLKRSAFHVAIAYKIYLDKLKQEGKSIENLEDIDPTKNARRVKTSQQPKNSKELSKKKK